MNITSNSDIKNLVSGLRRELKPFFSEKGPSHTQVLEAVSKALGYSCAAELQASLPKQPTVRKPKAWFPLSNEKGIFDLVEPGVSGTLVAGLNFEALEGGLDDLLYNTVLLGDATRAATGKLEVADGDETLINWDDCRSCKAEDGSKLYLTENRYHISENLCIVVPEGFDADDSEDLDTSLRVRQPLVDAYVRYIKEFRAPANATFEALRAEGLSGETAQDIAQRLGFSLHRAELDLVLKANVSK